MPKLSQAKYGRGNKAKEVRFVEKQRGKRNVLVPVPVLQHNSVKSSQTSSPQILSSPAKSNHSMWDNSLSHTLMDQFIDAQTASPKVNVKF